MGKYTDQTKLAAVRDYCSGEAGLKAVAQRHGVNVSSMRQRISGYRAHGEEGVLTKKRAPTNFSAEFKLSVLKRMRAEGLSQRQTTALFNIRRFNVIGEWKINSITAARKHSIEYTASAARRCHRHPLTKPSNKILITIAAAKT